MEIYKRNRNAINLHETVDEFFTFIGEKAQSFCCTTVGPCQLYLLLTRVVFCSTKKLKCHSSVLLRVLARICYREILSVATKYYVQCPDMSIGNIKNCIWKSFSDSVM